MTPRAQALAAVPAEMADRAVLVRHGGATTHRWRITTWWSPSDGCDEKLLLELAEREFLNASADLRQGAVALVYRGAVRRIATAPRLRTRCST